MKNNKIETFEIMAGELMKLALEIDAAQGRKKGAVQIAVKPLRRNLVVMLDHVVKALSRIFKL